MAKAYIWVEKVQRGIKEDKVVKEKLEKRGDQQASRIAYSQNFLETGTKNKAKNSNRIAGKLT